MVAHQQRCAFVGDALEAAMLHAVHRVAQQPDQKTHGELGHDPEDVSVDQDIEQRHHQEQLRDAQVRKAQQDDGENGRHHHEQGIENIVGGDDSRALVLGGARLDQRVQRHDIEAAEYPKADDRQQDPPGLAHAQQCQPVMRCCAGRHITGVPPPEQPEQRQAEGTEGHQADLDLAPTEPLT
ncbi:hypothetical protein D3C81_1224890 [compost metagenome]